VVVVVLEPYPSATVTPFDPTNEASERKILEVASEGEILLSMELSSRRNRLSLLLLLLLPLL